MNTSNQSSDGQDKGLSAGTKAPDFSLKTTPDQRVSLKEFRGQPVILIFYPADWSPVCSDEMALFNQVLPEFKKHRAILLGISVDNIWCHIAFAKSRNLHFPLLSDFHLKGEVSRLYDSYDENEGVSERALFLINEQGIIHWSYVAPIGINPGVDGVLQALEEMHAATPAR